MVNNYGHKNQLGRMPTSAHKEVSYYMFEFVKMFLYSEYTTSKNISELEVLRMTAIADNNTGTPQHVSVSDEKESDYLRVSNSHVDATVRFQLGLYSVFFCREKELHDHTLNFISILGIDANAKQSEELMQFLMVESMQTSPYRNSFIEVAPPQDISDDSDDVYVRPVNFDNDFLNDIYLPQNVRDYISLFIHTVGQYSPVNKSLRYLFAGKPGTAKTKIIRAIANACKGKATFIFTNGNEHRIESLFRFVELFSPVVLCIDDIDMMTGSREEGLFTRQLANFLQKMDGFVKRDFFLLATTNDKRLVDLAASRPGRFDLIINVNLIQPDLYISLVKSKTVNKEIIYLFEDEEVLASLTIKKVTGAFITNIVKHLELISSFEPNKLTQEYVLQIISETFQGFYKEPEPTNGKTGFVLA